MKMQESGQEKFDYQKALNLNNSISYKRGNLID
jgi:hypothetical protein